MSWNTALKTKPAQRREADGLIKIGDTLIGAGLIGLLITPLLILARAIFSAESQGVSQLLDIACQNLGSLFILVLAMAAVICLGVMYQKRGYKRIDVIESDNT